MRILVFGGTTEGRIVSGRLADAGHEVTVSVATELGAEQLNEYSNVSVNVGRLEVDEMVKLLGDHDICIDGTHPYAVVVSKNIRAATNQAGIPYYRLIREGDSLAELIEEGQEIELYASAAEVAERVRALGDDARVLLTTGSKEAKAYKDCRLEQLYIRILPSDESYQLCKAAGFDDTHIIQAFGPFSEEANLDIIRELGITHIVTKDGGRAGGFPEKISAAAKSKITTLIIKRPAETGHSMEEILKIAGKA